MNRNDIDNNDINTEAEQCIAELSDKCLDFAGISMTANELTILFIKHKKIISSLDELILKDTDLGEIPACILNLTKLRKLDVSGCGLTSVPDDIGKLKGIVKLNLSDNQITKLPDNIGKLKSLAKLNLSDNQLTDLPVSLGKMKSLAKLNLSDNPLNKLLKILKTLSMTKHLVELSINVEDE